MQVARAGMVRAQLVDGEVVVQPTSPVCEGVVVFHVDGFAECVEPGCIGLSSSWHHDDAPLPCDSAHVLESFTHRCDRCTPLVTAASGTKVGRNRPVPVRQRPEGETLLPN